MYDILLASALTCVIVVPTDQLPGNAHPSIVFRHERAHCNGMTVEPLIPPRRFDHKPKMPMKVIRLPTREAEARCARMGGNSYACQWFEPNGTVNSLGQ